MDIGRPAGVRARPVRQRIVQREINHEIGISPLVPLHPPDHIAADVLFSQEINNELPRVGTRGHDLPDADFLAVGQPNRHRAVVLDDDLAHAGPRADLTTLRMEVGGQRQRETVHPPLTTRLPRV